MAFIHICFPSILTAFFQLLTSEVYRILLLTQLIIGIRIQCHTIQGNSGLIVLVISNYQPDYSLNCTPLSPITITVFPMYKSTFYSLKICPKNSPRLIHGSKTEINKSSGQISIIIVSYGNKHPLLHSTSYGVFSLINLSS